MKLLLGVGGSEDAFRAIERTVTEVARTGDDLTVAIVENDDADPDSAAIEERVDAALTDANVSASIEHLSGHAGSQLVEFAESGTFDRIVLGGGQRSPMGKIQIGDIAEFVLLNSPITVTLIR